MLWIKQFLIVLVMLVVCLFATAVSAGDKRQLGDKQQLGGKQQLIWAGCGITKKAFMSELAKAYEAKTGIQVKLQGGGATKGIREAVKGTIHIGGACRAAMEHHDIERFANQIPVAWDALVVIVHPDNPVSNITFKQLRNVYLGKITNWNQLGGHNAPIKLYIRRGKVSGVGRTLRELVFANYRQGFTSRAIVVKSSGPAEKAVQSNLNAMTTTGISSAKRRKVKMLKLEGKSPTFENIQKGEYMLYRPLYLVIRYGETNPMVISFIDFATSFEGQEIIRSVGTVPYMSALPLVMKQIEQYKIATAAGL